MDPLDSPPSDHGSDRYGYVEVQGAPPDVSPSEEFVDRILARACQDCNPNLFIRWIGVEPGNPANAGNPWHVTVAHDDTCPRMKELES